MLARELPKLSWAYDKMTFASMNKTCANFVVVSVGYMHLSLALGGTGENSNISVNTLQIAIFCE